MTTGLMQAPVHPGMPRGHSRSLWHVLLSCAVLRCHKVWEESGEREACFNVWLDRARNGSMRGGRGGVLCPVRRRKAPPPHLPPRELMWEALFLHLPRSHNLQPATVPQALVCHGLAREPFSSLWLFACKSDSFRCTQIGPGGTAGKQSRTERTTWLLAFSHSSVTRVMFFGGVSVL